MATIFTAAEVIATFETHGQNAFKLVVKSSKRVSQFGAMFIDIMIRNKTGDYVPLLVKEIADIITINTPFHERESASKAASQLGSPNARIAFNPSEAMIRAIQIIDKYAVGALKHLIADAKTTPFGMQQYRRAINEFSAFKLIQYTRHQTDADGTVIDDVPLDAPIARSCIPFKRENGSIGTEPTWIAIKDIDGTYLHPRTEELNAIIPRNSKIRAAFSLGPIVLSAPGGRQTVSMRMDVQGVAITERGEPQSDRATEIADQL